MTVYTFIATKTTTAATIPSFVNNLQELVYRLRGALRANDYPLIVGELREFPLSTPQPNFLLCDGSEVPKEAFPQLYTYLGDSQGTPTDSDNFVLPDYQGTKAQAPTYPTQTVTGSDVSSGNTPAEPSGSGSAGGSSDYNPPSGGRPIRNNIFEV